MARATLDEMTYQISTKSVISLNQLQYWQRELKFQSELAPALRIGEGLQIELNKLYVKKLATQVNKKLSEWFHQSLSGSPSIELYKNLRAYLMLGNLPHRNNNILHHWQNDHPTAVSSSLFDTYIDNALTLELDTNLIKNARENLKSLSKNEISYLLFLDHSNATKSDTTLFSIDELKDISNFFNLHPSAFNFPEIYTKSWLLNKYDFIYDQTYHEFSQINWVMNSKLYTHNETLGEQHDFILKFYLQEYLDE